MNDHVNPFPGLRPFNTDEDYLFFGREQQISELLTLLRKSRFIAVLGLSGSGKSSVVRAGMLPELLGGGMTAAGSDWEVAIMRPGSHPIRNLAKSLCDANLYDDEGPDAVAQLTATLTRSSLGLVEAIRQSDIDSSANLLLVVDQFEELFRFGQRGRQNEDVAAAFVNLLLEASRQRERPTYVVVTMRSDFLGDCAQFTGLAEAINDGKYLVPRLSREQLKSVIEGPVRVGGGEVTGRLVQKLLNDIGRDQDQLPVLQHALMRTWDFWKQQVGNGRAIDLPDYEAVGGMQKALSRHADEIFDELPNDRARDVARHLFKAVTEYGSDNRGIRRPVRMGQLGAICDATLEEVSEVIDAFRTQGRTFLMPMESVPLTEDTVIDLSHESLMRIWQRLRDWVEEEAKSARIYQRLAETAVLNQEGRAGLYRDPDLQIALAWREQVKPNVHWAERYHPEFQRALAFLEDSQQAAQAEIDAKEKARQRELEQARKLAESESAHAADALRSARRLKSLALIMALVAVIAIGACIAAFVLKQMADLASVNAARSEQEALVSAEIARQAAKEADDSRTKAIEASNRADQEAEIAQAALAEMERARRARYFHQINLADWAWQTDDVNKAKEFLATCPHELRNWEWGYLNRLCHLKTIPVLRHTAAITGIASGAQGGIMAIGTADGMVFVINVDTGTIRKQWKAHLEPITGIAIRGPNLATASQDKTVKLWNVFSGQGIHVLRHETPVVALRFDPKRLRLATAGEDRVIRTWNLFTGAVIKAFPQHPDSINAIAYNNLGTRLASAGSEGSIKSWDVDKAEELDELRGHFGSVNDVLFGPKDSKKLISVGSDATVKIWDVKKAVLVESFESHSGPIRSLAISASGQRMATASDDQTIIVWRLQNGDVVRRLDRQSPHVAFSEDGHWLGTVTQNHELELIEQARQIVDAHRFYARGVAFGSNSQWLTSVSNNGSITFLNPVTGKVIPKPGFFRFGPTNEHKREIYAVASSHQGDLIATASADRTIKIWNAKSQKVLRTLKGHEESVWCVAFSPDDKRLVSCGDDKSIRFWNTETGQELAQLPRQNNPVRYLAFHPNGQVVATGCNNVVKLWDVNTKEELVAITDHADDVLSVKFSPDGRYLLTAGVDKTIKLRDAATGSIIRTLVGHVGSIRATAFSPDSKRFASTGADRRVILWEVSTGQEIRRLNDHYVQLYDVAFSPDGQMLAAAGYDGRVSIWEAWLPERVVSPESTWKWLHPQDGVDPASDVSGFHTSFFLPEFDDSSWNVGQDGTGPNQGFGYQVSGFEGVDIGTPEVPNRKTAYFRHRFTTHVDYESLILNMRRDVQQEDGVIVYLDGHEISSVNVTENAPEDYHLMSQRDTTAGFQLGMMSAEIPGKLSAGKHLLAISLHNNKADDGNFRISEISIEGRAMVDDSSHRSAEEFVSFSRPRQPKEISTLKKTPARRTYVLTASEFSSSANSATHQKSLWQLGTSTSNLQDIPTDKYLTEMEFTFQTVDPATKYYWRVQYEDASGRRSRFSRYGSFTTSGKRLIAAGSTWKYLHPFDGVDPATFDEDFHTTFANLDYDDSNWQVGKDSIGRRGGFGYGDLAGVMLKTPASENRKTAYFRHRFKSDGTYDNLVLKLQRDDGVIVYLDGKVVLRDNVQDGPDAYELYSSRTVSAANELAVNVFNLAETIGPGDHVLAISLHNRVGGSSDLRIAEISLSGELVDEEKTDDAGAEAGGSRR